MQIFFYTNKNHQRSWRIATQALPDYHRTAIPTRWAPCVNALRSNYRQPNALAGHRRRRSTRRRSRRQTHLTALPPLARARAQRRSTRAVSAT